MAAGCLKGEQRGLAGLKDRYAQIDEMLAPIMVHAAGSCLHLDLWRWCPWNSGQHGSRPIYERKRVLDFLRVKPRLLRLR